MSVMVCRRSYAQDFLRDADFKGVIPGDRGVVASPGLTIETWSTLMLWIDQHFSRP